MVDMVISLFQWNRSPLRGRADRSAEDIDDRKIGLGLRFDNPVQSVRLVRETDQWQLTLVTLELSSR
jgi:hypothetical protein